jgi:hypothetical protein
MREAEPGCSKNDLWRMLWEREREVGKALLAAWTAVEALATALVSRGTLQGDEAEAIIDGTFAGRSERSADRWAVVQRIHWAMPERRSGCCRLPALGVVAHDPGMLNEATRVGER